MAEKSSVVEVKKVLGKRRTKYGIEYLINWKGQGTKEYWVPFKHLHKSVSLIKTYNQTYKEKNSNQVSEVTGRTPVRKSVKPRKVPPQKKGQVTLKGVTYPTLTTEVSPAISSHDPSSENTLLSPSMASTLSNGLPSGGTALNVIDTQTLVTQPKKRKYVRKVLDKGSGGQGRKSGNKMIGSVNNKKRTSKTAVKMGIRNSTNGKSKMPTTRKNISKLVRKSMQIEQSTESQGISHDVSGLEASSLLGTASDAMQIGHMQPVSSQTSEAKNKKGVRAKGAGKANKLIVKMPATKKRSAVNGDTEDGKTTSSTATSDSEGMLYSLADADISSSDTSVDEAAEVTQKQAKRRKTSPTTQIKRRSPVTKKHLVLKLIDLKHEVSEGCTTTTPDSDPEVSFKVSPRKLLLKDSIKPKSKSVKLASVSFSKQVSPVKGDSASKLPHSPRSSSAAPSTCKSPTRPTSHLVERDPSPSLASTNDLPRIPPVIPILPNSPMAPRYDILVKHMTTHYNQTRGMKRQLELDSEKGPVERRVSVRHSESAYKYKEIVVKKNQNYTQIWLFSQTKRKNALNPKVCQELIEALHNAKFDDTRVVLLTGSGRVFCSGVDLHYLTDPSVDRRTSARKMAESIKDFVNAMVAFPKPIVAAVNGPAVGLGVAILPLCDIIYASDKASFFCPYTKLGQTPEGCSSYTFPHAMGLAMANELLLPGRKITAIEAYQIGLVSQVFWPTSMMQEVIPRLQQMAATSAKALEASKVLIRSHVRGKLQLTVETECQMLTELWPSAECQKAMLTYIEEDEDMMT